MALAANNTTTTTTSCDSDSPHLQWILRVAYSAIFLIGLLGNFVVCIAIMKRRQMRTSNNLFTFNLALHDLLLVLIYVPTQMIAMEHCHNWVIGDFMCHLVYFILPLCQSASSGTLLAITADRYRAIVFPMKAKLSQAQVALILAVIWMASLVTALPLIFVTKTISPSPGVRYCTEIWPKDELYSIYWILIFAVQYVIPLSAIAVLAAIMSAHLNGNLGPLVGNCFVTEAVKETIKRRVKQTRKITKMLVALVLLYAICMLPQHLVFTFWLKYGDLAEKSFKEHIFVVANIFPIANSALNPLAYGTLNKDFKAVFKNLLRWLCGKAQHWESAQRTLRLTARRFQRADKHGSRSDTKQETLTEGDVNLKRKRSEENEKSGNLKHKTSVEATAKVPKIHKEVSI